ncbi:hypothetical protein Acr_23g0020430 [Actinidia rufa]|uniref:Uncharacterized protein n=1 Tax=Actinidia rufa TaxID=165716 RepID=A0A7J0GSB9_9ERIC|nr:hypothetical protein Acr_23g0020430 [Actinidia rufa]
MASLDLRHSLPHLCLRRRSTNSPQQRLSSTKRATPSLDLPPLLSSVLDIAASAISGSVVVCGAWCVAYKEVDLLIKDFWHLVFLNPRKSSSLLWLQLLPQLLSPLEKAKLDEFWVTTPSQPLLILHIHSVILTTVLSWDSYSTPWRTGFPHIVRASHETLGLSVADYFGFLQSHWEELAQYEPLSDFPAAAATIVSQRLTHHHTYLFLIGLKSKYESLHIQILNTSPLPSLYEAFAIIDGDEHRCCLIQASPAISPGSTPIADQIAFVAFGSNTRSFGGRPICSYCADIGHISERYFKLHPELRGKSFKHKGKGPPRTATVADTSPGPQQPSASTATLATGTPIAFHARASYLTWILDSGANDHVTGTPSLTGPNAATIPANLDGLPRLIHLFDSPPVQVPPTSAAQASLKVYTRRAPLSPPLPDSSSVSGTSPSHLVPTSVSPRYPFRCLYFDTSFSV